MKKILLVLLLSVALGGCATLSNVYNGVKERIYPAPKPIVKEEPAPTTPPAPEPKIVIPDKSEAEAVTPPVKKSPRRIKWRPKHPVPKKTVAPKTPDVKDDLQKEPTPPRK